MGEGIAKGSEAISVKAGKGPSSVVGTNGSGTVPRFHGGVGEEVEVLFLRVEGFVMFPSGGHEGIFCFWEVVMCT